MGSLVEGLVQEVGGRCADLCPMWPSRTCTDAQRDWLALIWHGPRRQPISSPRARVLQGVEGNHEGKLMSP